MDVMNEIALSQPSLSLSMKTKMQNTVGSPIARTDVNGLGFGI
jgi:hypothetical protein